MLPSPDVESFSTPPTTPGVHDSKWSTTSKRNSRPISLHIDKTTFEWRPDLVVESSPELAKKTNLLAPGIPNSQTITPAASHSSSPTHQPPQSPAHHYKPMVSPCFVHSYLDKGGSLTDWLRNQYQRNDGGDVGVAKGLLQNNLPKHKLQGTTMVPPQSNTTTVIETPDDEDDMGRSLTRQLAETAVGVREMSKQLGRTRVRSNIQNVLIVTKARDNRLIRLTRELALYLMLKQRPGQNRGLTVYVDHQLRNSRRFDAEGIERDHPDLFVPFPQRRSSSNSSRSSNSSSSNNNDEVSSKEEGQLRYWTSAMCSHSPHLFDFVVTLGGDGTVLFTSWLFQRIVPPVLPFALGSLGFLTPFDFAEHQAVMDSAIDSGIRVNLRMRFTCTIYRAVGNEAGKGRKAVKKGSTGEIMMKDLEKGGWEALEGGWLSTYSVQEGGKAKDKEIMCFTTRPVETFEVINDLVVDRGPSPYVSQLELFGDEHHMTTVQADGLTISTPTGSTAYSLSAGGSLVHPEIPAILITPICPHTLSFRPMLLPDSMELRVCVPFNSRSTAWASFDGRGRVELKQGDHIKVTASKYPFPTVCADKQSTDWFHAISRTLKWNERERQKSFVVVEEGPAKHKKRAKRDATVTAESVRSPIEPAEGNIDDEEDEVSDEEEEKFDIDDSSPEASHMEKDEQALSCDKAQETPGSESRPLLTAAVKKSLRRSSKSRSRSRSGVRSGVQTPGRFACPQPHPPSVSPRHVEFAGEGSSPESTDYADELGHRGTRDDHGHKRSSGNNRDRDLELDLVKTPTVSQSHRGRGHRRTNSIEYSGPRAFAVWGHDESDSATSDSDV